MTRLNSDGTKDASFTCSTDDNVRAIAIQPDGKIFIAGEFSHVDKIEREGIARLNTDGSLDTSFNPGSGTGGLNVFSIALQSDGKILVGGNFTSFYGISRNKVARLNSDGSLDLAFDPGTGFSGSSNFVQTILLQPDGRILVGGDFTSYNGTTLNRFARLNSNGSLDSTFASSFDGEVEAIAYQPDAKIIVGGLFTSHLARLLNHFPISLFLPFISSRR